MKEIIVRDSVLADPARYRALAASLEYKTFEFPEATFHGIAPVSGMYPEAIHQVLRGAIPRLSFFRRSPAGQVEPHFIHTDIDMGQWSAILYLNENPPPGDGTAFWTHKATGQIGSTVPHERSEEGRMPEGWEMRQLVEAKFNRLVIFPSEYFHSRSIFENWGDDKESRLTQVTFGVFQ